MKTAVPGISQTAKVQLNKRSGDRPLLWLPQDWLENLHLRDGDSVLVKFGLLKARASVKHSPYPEHVFASRALYQALGLVSGVIHLQVEMKDQLRFGPVIGLFTSMHLPYQTTMLKAGAEKGIFFYLFRPQDIDWQHRKVQATFVQRTEGGWRLKRQLCPLPEVVYERIPNRRAEKRPEIRLCLQKLRDHPEIHIFNQGYYDKWTIYERLALKPEVREYLPDTRLVSSAVIREMLTRYHDIYLKPVHGSLGLGIIRAKLRKTSVHPSSLIQCEFYQMGAMQKVVYTNTGEMVSHLLGRRVTRYLVQPAIDLVNLAGRPVDFRVHLQRDGKGDWRIIATAAKVAGHGTVTTHVRTGGQFLPAKETLMHIFYEQRDEEHAERLMKEMHRASLAIAEAVAEDELGPVGELGLDVGIDRRGRIWLFEVNAKPGRHIFRESWLHNEAKQSVKAIVDYACYLSHFQTITGRE